MATGHRINILTGETEQFEYTPDPVPVPSAVTRRQAKRALNAAGHLATVEGLIAQADTATQIDWTDALEFRRDHPLIAAISAELELTTEEIDDLFRAAALII